MNISNYSSYFHDGAIIDINHMESLIIFSMESAEISADENLDNIILSEYSTIKGKLYLNGVDLITENEKSISPLLTMKFDSAGILHFKIHGRIVTLDLIWKNYPPHPQITSYSFYKLYAKKIFWENIPDLKDPFS